MPARSTAVSPVRSETDSFVVRLVQREAVSRRVPVVTELRGSGGKVVVVVVVVVVGWGGGEGVAVEKEPI